MIFKCWNIKNGLLWFICLIKKFFCSKAIRKTQCHGHSLRHGNMKYWCSFPQYCAHSFGFALQYRQLMCFKKVNSILDVYQVKLDCLCAQDMFIIIFANSSHRILRYKTSSIACCSSLGRRLAGCCYVNIMKQTSGHTQYSKGHEWAVSDMALQNLMDLDAFTVPSTKCRLSTHLVRWYASPSPMQKTFKRFKQSGWNILGLSCELICNAYISNWNFKAWRWWNSTVVLSNPEAPGPISIRLQHSTYRVGGERIIFCHMVVYYTYRWIVVIIIWTIMSHNLNLNNPARMKLQFYLMLIPHRNNSHHYPIISAVQTHRNIIFK